MKTARGFTLLEVLIAMTILAGSIIVISNTWSGNFLRFRKSNLFNNVALLLEAKMAEIEAKYRDKPLEEIPDEEAGEFEGNPNYRWVMKSQEFEMPDLSAILIKQSDGANENLLSMIKQMSEYISKSVKEVKVSVLVKAGKKEVEFTITTYFVDYKKEIGLGGASP